MPTNTNSFRPALPAGISRFEVVFTSAPVLVKALRGSREEPVDSHPARNLLVEGHVLVECTKPHTASRLDYVFVGQEFSSFLVYPGNHCQAAKRLRHAAFTVFEQPTQLTVGENRFPFAFNIKPDYLASLHLKSGGVRYGVTAHLQRDAAAGNAFTKLLKQTPRLLTVDAVLRIRTIIVPEPDLPTYSLHNGPADTDEEGDVQSRTEALGSSGVAIKVDVPSRIVFYTSGNAGEFGPAPTFPLSVRLIGAQTDDKVTLKQVQWSLKEEAKCSAGYMDNYALSCAINTMSDLEQRTLLGPGSIDVGAGTTVVELPIAISNDAPTTWLPSYIGSHVNVSHKLKVTVVADIDGKEHKAEFGIPISIHGADGGEKSANDVNSYGKGIAAEASIAVLGA
ncbi:hypothetical protein DFJ77DRAFT_465647 [Powellomyces hirtus]|nr:hypothetical protein DFJ77DRAFT_465647 [Powellomyces hirtus]